MKLQAIAGPIVGNVARARVSADALNVLNRNAFVLKGARTRGCTQLSTAVGAVVKAVRARVGCVRCLPEEEA